MIGDAAFRRPWWFNENCDAYSMGLAGCCSALKVEYGDVDVKQCLCRAAAISYSIEFKCSSASRKEIPPSESKLKSSTPSSRAVSSFASASPDSSDRQDHAQVGGLQHRGKRRLPIVSSG